MGMAEVMGQDQIRAQRGLTGIQKGMEPTLSLTRDLKGMTRSGIIGTRKETQIHTQVNPEREIPTSNSRDKLSNFHINGPPKEARKGLARDLAGGGEEAKPGHVPHEVRGRPEVG